MASEEEIRDLVRRVVDRMASGENTDKITNSEADIAIGADHGGYDLKEKLISYLRDQGYKVRDCGTSSPDAVDYPDYAHAVGILVATGACKWGLMVDGAGIGSCMAANKVPGVRAALCYDLSSARNSREHNHANVLTLGAGLIGDNLAKQIVKAWLDTSWGEGRHARRVEKVMEIERLYGSSLPKEKGT